jgi:hypothetical protein
MKLTDEQEAYLKKMADPHYYGEQDENGVDISLIRRNLALTAEERLRRGSIARKNMLRLREIGRQNRKLRT